MLRTAGFSRGSGFTDLLLVRRFQQRGRAAEEAANTFYYLTYEGTVDLDDIDDPLQRKVLTGE
jgi:beige protein homolog 1